MLPNLPQKPKTSSNFEQLLAEEKADKQRQDAALKRQKGNYSRNQKVAFGIMGGLITLIIVVLAVYDPFTGAPRFGGGPGQVGIKAPSSAETLQTPKWWQEPGNVYPIALNDWQKQAFTPSKADSIYKSIDTFYSGKSLESYALELPAESTGFTHDTKQQFLADGTLNPMFSYLTKEVFVSEAGSMIERIINPTYGNWAADGYNGRLTEVSYKALSDLFAKTWLAQHPNSDAMPLFLSPNHDITYLPSGGTRWIGQVDNLQATFTYDLSIRNYKIAIIADISYTSWTSDKRKLVEKAKLNLSLVPNQDEYNNGSSNHIVIDGSKLEVTG